MVFYSDSIPTRPQNHILEVPGTDQRPQNMMGRDIQYTGHVPESYTTEAVSAEPPIKEVRTYTREGTTITEEYERLNPDGTVTKTITVGDRRDGLKHFGVYKMDKSGIVRRIENAEPREFLFKGTDNTSDKYAWLEELKKTAAAQKARMSPEVLTNSNKIENHFHVEKPDHDLTYDRLDQLTQRQTQLTPQQRALIDEFKENYIKYGTKKLENILKQKVMEDKFNKQYPMTDEQKEQLIHYGVKKLEKLLNKNLDEEKILPLLQQQNEGYENQNIISRGDKMNNPTSYPVSFVLQPSNDIKQNKENMGTFQQHMSDTNNPRPVSFVIRPENEVKTYSVPMPSPNNHHTVNNGCKAFWKERLHGRKTHENIPLSQEHKHHKAGGDGDDNDNDDNIDNETLQDSLKKLGKNIKHYLKGSNSKENASEKQHRADLLNYALKGIKKIINGTKYEENMDEKIESSHKREKNSKLDMMKHTDKDHKLKSKKENSKDKYSLFDLFDEDEIFDNGLKSLKKHFKNREKSEKYEEEGTKSHKDKHDFKDKILTPNQQFNEYTNKDTLLRPQHKHDIPDENYLSFKLRPQADTKPPLQNAGGIKSAFNTFPSQDHETKSQKQYGESKSDNKSKLFEFNTLLSKIQQAMAQNKNISSQQNEYSNSKSPLHQTQHKVSKTRSDSTSTQENKKNTFDLNSILSKLQQMKNQNQTEGNSSSQHNDYSKHKALRSNQSQPQPNTNMNAQFVPSQDEQKSVDIDLLLSRIRNALSQNSETGSSQENSKEKSSPSYQHPQQLNSRKETGNTYSQQNNSNNGSISFNIHPKDFGNLNEKSFRSSPNEQINTEKINQPNDNFVPWWFEQSSQPRLLDEPIMRAPFLKKPLALDPPVKVPPLQDSFFHSPLLKDSFIPNLLE